MYQWKNFENWLILNKVMQFGGSLYFLCTFRHISDQLLLYLFSDMRDYAEEWCWSAHSQLVLLGQHHRRSVITNFHAWTFLYTTAQCPSMCAFVLVIQLNPNIMQYHYPEVTQELQLGRRNFPCVCKSNHVLLGTFSCIFLCHVIFYWSNLT